MRPVPWPLPVALVAALVVGAACLPEPPPRPRPTTTEVALAATPAVVEQTRLVPVTRPVEVERTVVVTSAVPVVRSLVVTRPVAVTREVLVTRVVTRQVPVTRQVTRVVTRLVPVTATITPTPARRYAVGFLSFDRRQRYPADIEASLEAAAGRDRRLSLVALDSGGDAQAVVGNAERLRQQRVDGAILFTGEGRAGLLALERLRAAGIPLVSVDAYLPGATYVGVDNFRAGFIAGQEMARLFQRRYPTATPLLVLAEVPAGGGAVAARSEGYLEGVRSVYPTLAGSQVRRIDTHNAPDVAQRAMSALLDDLPAERPLMAGAVTDALALSLVAAVREAGRAGEVVVTSLGAGEAARREMCSPDSPLIGATGFFPERYGDLLVPTILALMEGRPVPPAVYTHHRFVTPETMAQDYPDQPCPAAAVV